MRHLKIGLGVMLVLALLSACDEQRSARLEEGVSTESDVRKQFGEPVQIVEHADGSRVLDYPRQPEGTTNYQIEIGTDGRMRSLRQLLSPANFAKVLPGMSQDAVRQQLGRPARQWQFPTRPEESVWDWRFEEAQTRKVFSVTFGRELTVLRTATTDDTRFSDPGR